MYCYLLINFSDAINDVTERRLIKERIGGEAAYTFFGLMT